MIFIDGVERPVDNTSWPQLAKNIYEQKRKSPISYHYHSTQHLQFEMTLRTRMVEAARALSRSGAGFAIKSRCNEQFWNLTSEGGFRLKDGVTPASGIRDIFVDGKKYAFECATAIVIVMYKGVLDTIKESEFNRLFANLLLYDWHYDSDLRLTQEQGSEKAYPGDVLYFKNPDVSPQTPQWQGENTVKVDDDLFYGHGIGIVPQRVVINILNRFRRPGSRRSAYLTNQVVYPDFLYLSQFAPGTNRLDEQMLQQFYLRTPYIRAQIGGRRFVIGV